MNTEQTTLKINELEVSVVRKAIKHLHLGVYPPDGRVRVAAPVHVDDETIRLAVIARWSWIRKQQQRFREQERQSQREMVTGESHYFLGRRYRLDLVERPGAPRIRIRNAHTLELAVPPGTDAAARRAILDRWYRRQLRALLPELLQKWEPVIGVKVRELRIKKMKTRWGTCNAEAARIWLNLELVKKPPQCIEYVLVHEMVHLLERSHNERFVAFMDRFLPQWRLLREELNRAPLAHAAWKY